jgi:hypothetical protein
VRLENYQSASKPYSKLAYRAVAVHVRGEGLGKGWEPEFMGSSRARSLERGLVCRLRPPAAPRCGKRPPFKKATERSLLHGLVVKAWPAPNESSKTLRITQRGRRLFSRVALTSTARQELGFHDFQ